MIYVVTRKPDIDAQRLKIGATLLFGLDHRGILHSGVRNFPYQIGTRNNDLAWLDQDIAIDGQMQFSNSSQSQIGTSLALPYALANTNERSGRKPEAIAMKLQHHIIALVGLEPEPVAAIRAYSGAINRAQVHDLAFNRGARRVGTEAVYLDVDPLRPAVQYALVSPVNADNSPVDRAYDTQWRGRNRAMRITKNQHQYQEKQSCCSSETDIQITHCQTERSGGRNQKR
jgi:hypothetical protein